MWVSEVDFMSPDPIYPPTEPVGVAAMPSAAHLRSPPLRRGFAVRLDCILIPHELRSHVPSRMELRIFLNAFNPFSVRTFSRSWISSRCVCFFRFTPFLLLSPLVTLVLSLGSHINRLKRLVSLYPPPLTLVLPIACFRPSFRLYPARSWPRFLRLEIQVRMALERGKSRPARIDAIGAYLIHNHAATCGHTLNTHSSSSIRVTVRSSPSRPPNFLRNHVNHMMNWSPNAGMRFVVLILM
jgi:hypothetical protein